MQNILIVDDNADIRNTTCAHLQEQGLFVQTADSGETALDLIRNNDFDCIVLDIVMPGMDGVELCQTIRETTDCPIIFISCLGNTNDKIRALMSGGDDYMTKPYSLRELHARIIAHLRRNEQQQGGEFYLDELSRIVHVKGTNVLLSKKELRLLQLFLANKGRNFSQAEIISELWPDKDISENTVAVHILNLRRKLDFAGEYLGYIINDYGSGYRLEGGCI